MLQTGPGRIKEMSTNLAKCYYDSKHPGSFGGSARLAYYAKSTKTRAERFLRQEPSYTRNKSVRHKFKRRKYNHPHVDYCWQADLIDVSKFARSNGGNHFLLTVICTLSRFAFVKPLKRKTGTCVREAFASIFLDSGRVPKYLQTDRGNEFDNKQVRDLLLVNNIVLFHNHSPLKAAMIERFNRTLMMRLNKFFTKTGKTRYLDDLQNIVKSYNLTEHSSTKLAPGNVSIYNQMDVWLESNKDLIQRKHRRAKYKEGQYVRIKINKPIFTKGYSCAFSDELYRICEVVNSRPITYKLIANDGTKILGIFYENEMSPVTVE